MVTEAALNAFGEQLKDLTLCKTRYDLGDLQWYTEGPFWRRTSMRSVSYTHLDVYKRQNFKPSGLMGTKEFTIAGAKNFLGRFRTRGKEG